MRAAQVAQVNRRPVVTDWPVVEGEHRRSARTYVLPVAAAVLLEEQQVVQAVQLPPSVLMRVARVAHRALQPTLPLGPRSAPALGRRAVAVAVVTPSLPIAVVAAALAVQPTSPIPPSLVAQVLALPAMVAMATSGQVCSR